MHIFMNTFGKWSTLAQENFQMSIFHFLFIQNYEYFQNCGMLDSVTSLNLLYCLSATRGGTLEQGAK